jgi:hypothetical protein
MHYDTVPKNIMNCNYYSPEPWRIHKTLNTDEVTDGWRCDWYNCIGGYEDKGEEIYRM